MPVYHRQGKFLFLHKELSLTSKFEKRVKNNVPICRSCYKTNRCIYVMKQIMYLCYKTDNIQIIYLLQNIIEECDKRNNLSMAISLCFSIPII